MNHEHTCGAGSGLPPPQRERTPHRRAEQHRPELVFSAPAADYVIALMSLDSGSLRVDTARPWADNAPVLREMFSGRMYALHPDGLRVAIAPPSEEETAPRTHLTLVLNVADELRRLAPTEP